MIIDIKDNTVTITYEQSDTIGRSFRDEIKIKHKNFSFKNIILDLSPMKNVLSKHLKDFVKLAIYHKQFNNKSFIVVTGPIGLEHLPDGINVVPSINEAIDMIEIEDIERDLGY